MLKVLVVGLGISGRSAAAFLLHRGFSIRGVDRDVNMLNTNPEIQLLKKQGLHVSHEDEISDVKEYDLVVVSPGIPQDHRLYLKAIQHGVDVCGEIELGCRLVKNKMIGITGTNGKTTVTLLVAHALNSTGIKAKALGNVGVPLTKELIDVDPAEVLVVELSSYQLETMYQHVLDVAVLLNITPDHLDRYGSMDEYAKAKFIIGRCMKSSGKLFVEERAWKEYGRHYAGKPVSTYGYTTQSTVYTDLQSIYIHGKNQLILPSKYAGRASHDLENIMASFAICHEMGVSATQFLAALESFKKPSHRIEWVREKDGVDYYDDSKGTNIDATIRAVQTMPGPVVLIAGGVDKGSPYTPWVEAFANKVKCVCAIGQAADKIKCDLAGSVAVQLCRDLDEAVNVASGQAQAGDSVLLSPGCSSFDMFRDYAHRGDEFQRVVRKL